ncbi:MAG: hypothetical protein J6T38_10030 [Bacteroidaceae bacterium]|nr:hypothetical protein [Bacteroidaceae bacterium]
MKRFVLVITTLLVCFCVNAQNQAFGRIQNPRAEFNPELYTKRMNEFVAREAHLTDAESAKFFPLLNEMQNKQRQIGRQQREIMMKAFRNTNISEEDYEQMVMRITGLEIESRKVEQTYYKKFHTVLSWKKIYGVRVALARFQVEALNQFQPGRGATNRFTVPQWNRNTNNNNRK